MADEPVPFLLLRLQARYKNTDKWTDIWPAQFEQFQRLGCEIRIIESSPGDQEMAEIDAWIASLPDDPKAVEAIIDRIKPWCCGAFTGWKGHTGDSKITLDEAEEHFVNCMLDMQDDLRRFLLTNGT